MDGTLLQLILFLAATFVASIVTGVAGFAFGLVASGIWLHVLTPLQTATLIVAYGLVVQGRAVWKLRRNLEFRLLWPFLVGGALGVPVGVSILGLARPDYMRAGVGAILIVYSLYGLLRPTLLPAKSVHPLVDGTVGFLNGVLGGLTGLSGLLIVIWCGLRGWPRDVQRAVFQPTLIFVFVLTAISFAVRGDIALDTMKLFVLGLPLVLLGTWIGMGLYGRLDEAGFRRVVLILLLLSGVALVGPWIVGMFRS